MDDFGDIPTEQPGELMHMTEQISVNDMHSPFSATHLRRDLQVNFNGAGDAVPAANRAGNGAGIQRSMSWSLDSRFNELSRVFNPRLYRSRLHPANVSDFEDQARAYDQRLNTDKKAGGSGSRDSLDRAESFTSSASSSSSDLASRTAAAPSIGRASSFSFGLSPLLQRWRTGSFGSAGGAAGADNKGTGSDSNQRARGNEGTDHMH